MDKFNYIRISNKFKLKLYKILFFLTLWGPPKGFLSPSRSAEASLRGDLGSGQYIAILIWFIIGFVSFLKMCELIWKRDVYYHKIIHNKEMRIYFLFMTIAIFSSIYSVNPKFSAFMAFKLFVGFSLTFILIRELYLVNITPFYIFRLIYFYYLVSMLLSFIIFFIKPELVARLMRDGFYRIIGGYIFSAAYGVDAFYVFLYHLFIHPFEKKNTNYCIIAVSLFMIVFARTRFLYIMFFNSLSIIVLMNKTLSRKIRYCIVCVLVAVVLIIYISPQSFNFLVREKKSLSTLSDRTNVWDYGFRQINKELLFGYGFIAGGRVTALHINQGMGHMHNSHMDTLMGVGLIGIIPYLLTFIFISINIYNIRKIKLKEYWVILIWWILLLANGVSEVNMIFLALLMVPIVYKNVRLDRSAINFL